MEVKRTVLFVQGGGPGVHDEWDDKLVASLARELGPDYEIRYPRMPREEDPRYAAWKAAIEEALASLDDRAVLVGHSIGGTMLIRMLAAQSTKRRFAAVFLVAAPFVGDGGWSSDELEPAADLGARLPRDTPVHIYHGLDDGIAPPSHAELYGRAIPQARVHCLPGRDHQLNDDLHEIAAGVRALDDGTSGNGGIPRVTSESRPLPGFVVLYRWRLHPGSEETFIEAWSRTTDLLRARGSLGSRLHRGSDGLWYGYAQWPSAQARAKAFASGPVDDSAMTAMRQAIAESLPETVLEPVADFLVPMQNGA